MLSTTTSSGNNKTGKKTGKNVPQNASEGCELDAEKMAGQVMKPRSVMSNDRRVL